MATSLEQGTAKRELEQTWAENDDTEGQTATATKKQKITKQQCIEHLQSGLPEYDPPFNIEEKPWFLQQQYADWDSKSPVDLFLLFFAPILALLVLYTNTAAHRDTDLSSYWKDVDLLEIKRWIGIRLQIAVSGCSIMQDYWAQSRSHESTGTRYLGYQRFAAIEKYRSISSEPDQDDKRWFSKIGNTIDTFREHLRSIAVPATYLSVDEASVKFHGRSSHTHLMRHKPAKKGFVLFILASDDCFIHDFTLISSVEGIEDFPKDEPTYIGLSTGQYLYRRLRARGPGSRMTNTEIKIEWDAIRKVELPPTKAAVFELVRRIREQYPDRQYVAFLDNLFTNVPLAQALASINCGLVGTTRKDAIGIPSVELALKNDYPGLLEFNQLSASVVEEQVCVVTFSDNSHVVAITTAYSPSWRTLSYKTRSKKDPVQSSQLPYWHKTLRNFPQVFEAYNYHMNAVDIANHLRETTTIRRGRALKWTKRLIELLVDWSQSNAYIIWRKKYDPKGLNHHLHKEFIQAVINGLFVGPDKHYPTQRKPKRLRCKHPQCQTKQCPRKANRQVLGDITNLQRPPKKQFYKREPRKTTWYCERCSVPLCKDAGCFEDWHAKKMWI